MDDVLARLRQTAARESRGGRPRQGVPPPPQGRRMPDVEIPGVPGVPDVRWTGGKRRAVMRAPGVGGGGPHAVRSMQIPAANFARPSTGAAQVKRISR